MARNLNRRAFVRVVGAAVTLGPCFSARGAQDSEPRFSYPMSIPGRPLGDGFFIRIAYAAENAPYHPGWWHTGENWHALDGDTAGLEVFAAADGEVVFAGYDYPGLVVILRHDEGLFSMYGHLDHTVAVEPGQRVTRGELLGTVLARSDDYSRSHLHFELRSFFTKAEINGAAPKYGVSCGYECPPGPGYWPMGAPEHPSELGWLNPTHVINRRAWSGGIPGNASVVLAEGAPAGTRLWRAPADRGDAESLGEVALASGESYPLLEIAAGDEAATGTSAEATSLWYRIATPDGRDGWVQAVVPVAIDAGSDGRPSSLRFHFLPAAVAN